jgi:ABC-2 type transport system permease protein
MKGRGWIQYAAVVRKETLQTARDRRILFMLVMAPFIQTVLFGLAVDFDVDRVPTTIVDLDRSAQSREHSRRLLADGTLREAVQSTSAQAAEGELDEDGAMAALIFPSGFGKKLDSERTAVAQLVLDGTDPTRSGAAASAASRYFGDAAKSLAEERTGRANLSLPIEVVPRVLYNPSLETPVFIVPGILAMLLVVVTTIVTAMGLSREKEVGTLEQVMVTPIKPLVLLLGKMTPFVAIGLFDALLVLTAMTWIFDVPVRGSLWLLALGTVLYLCSTLGVGLLVSTLSSTQQQSFLGGFLFILPAALLSGVMTPIRTMPEWLQMATVLNPLRWYAELVRGVLLKGTTLADVHVQLSALLAFGAGILALATARFQKRLR